MALADELLELAQDIAKLHVANPRQASLRRAVSTAYYAIFHLLISEATLNWARPELRPALGRLFDHGPMNTASTNKVADLDTHFKGDPPQGPERNVAEHLRRVAIAFSQAQQRRIDADYNTAKEVTDTDMIDQIETVRDAFKRWNLIRDEGIAQAYLLSMLGSQRRQSEPKRPKEQKGRKKKSGKPQPPPSFNAIEEIGVAAVKLLVERAPTLL